MQQLTGYGEKTTVHDVEPGAPPRKELQTRRRTSTQGEEKVIKGPSSQTSQRGWSPVSPVPSRSRGAR